LRVGIRCRDRPAFVSIHFKAQFESFTRHCARFLERTTVGDQFREGGAPHRIPDTARITLRTVTTEDGAQATITVTSDEPIPAGTVSLASLSVSPRQSGAHLGALSRLHVHEINSELPGEPQSIRIPMGDIATRLSDTSDTDWNIEFMAAWRDDGWAPTIRLKAPAAHPGADPAPETIDRDEDTADIGTPVKIAMPIPPIDGAHANGLQRTHRWIFDHTCHDTAGRLPQVRIPHL
jgi:hypothetical protein